jgi:hypothetical protein
MKLLVFIFMCWTLVLLLDFHPIYPISLIDANIRFGLFLTIEILCCCYLVKKFEGEGW